MTAAHTEDVADEVLRDPRAIPKLTQAALAAGHEPKVVRDGRRFRLACACGWRTRENATRKAAFQAVADHVAEVGSRYLLDQQLAAGYAADDAARVKNGDDTPPGDAHPSTTEGDLGQDQS